MEHLPVLPTPSSFQRMRDFPAEPCLRSSLPPRMTAVSAMIVHHLMKANATLTALHLPSSIPHTIQCQLVVSLVWGFWKWLEFWLDDKWSRFMAESKQKCLNRIVWDTRIGVFWFGQKSLRIYFFFTWKEKNLPILSINAVSPEIAKRRILASLWRSPILQILQTENLKRKASHFDWRRYKNQFYIIQAAQDACASYLRTANVS